MKMSNRNRVLVVVLLGVVGVWTPGAMALPVEVPDFGIDPSGLEFQINPIFPGEGLSNNIIGPPNLIYGESDPITFTNDVLVMNWEPGDTSMPAQAGWELAFGSDPDLTNQTISLSINPPGIGGVGPAGGITHLEVVIVDINGLSAGGWGFNTDQAFGGAAYVPLGNDPLLSGIAPILPIGPPPPPPVASLAQNFMQTVNINIGSGPAAGSATILGGPAGTLAGPNYLLAGNGGNIALAIKIEFYENGILASNVAVPVNAVPGLNNYWDHIIVTPEPATLAMLAIGGIAMLRRRK